MEPHRVPAGDTRLRWPDDADTHENPQVAGPGEGMEWVLVRFADAAAARRERLRRGIRSPPPPSAES